MSPIRKERREIAVLHFEAIEAFEELAESLQVSEAVSPFWQKATALTSRWLGAVEYI
jgi:hypothetical protein